MKALHASAASLLLSATALLACGAAWSQAATATTGCDSRQDPAACAREAGAARQEAARGGLTRPGVATAEQNATARCQALPTNEQSDCLARMQGAVPGPGTTTTTTSGSVMGGGVIRETVTTMPAPSR